MWSFGPLLPGGPTNSGSADLFQQRQAPAVTEIEGEEEGVGAAARGPGRVPLTPGRRTQPGPFPARPGAARGALSPHWWPIAAQSESEGGTGQAHVTLHRKPSSKRLSCARE